MIAHADSSGIDDYAQASMSVIAECSVGQRVWPRCAANQGCRIKMFPTAKHTNVFSGYLLYRLD